MLEQHKESSITIKQYFNTGMLGDLLLTFGYAGLIILITFFLGVVYVLPNKM